MISDFATGATTRAGEDGGDAPHLVIGLINNMPMGAKRAAEQQFSTLMETAGHHHNLSLRLFTIDDYPIKPDATFRLLREAQPDGLIVTGDEPQAAAISDEPLWPALARLVDWASDNTISCIWSCLAAHAAVFRLDGIERRQLAQKLSGIYACTSATDHPLLAEFPSRWMVPHSRWNTVEEADLRREGYIVLSHAPRVGADIFLKRTRESLFLFLQGHPEYAPDNLFREYRRDVRRFLAGERQIYPEMPENYFDRKTARALAQVREQAHQAPSPRLLASVYAAFSTALLQSDNLAAMRLYGNWLGYLATQKAARDAAPQWPVPQYGAA